MSHRNRFQRRYAKRLIALLRHPLFWTLTILGNSIILLGGFVLYWFESNPVSHSPALIDCLLWSAGTVTTVGYGSLTPQTLYGKMSLLVLMLTGPIFVWSYMAFLVTGLIAPELSSLERDVHEVERELHGLKIES